MDREEADLGVTIHRVPPEALRPFALGMCDGAIRQARGPVRNVGAPGSGSRSVRLPSRTEWVLGWTACGIGWAQLAARL